MSKVRVRSIEPQLSILLVLLASLSLLAAFVVGAGAVLAQETEPAASAPAEAAADAATGDDVEAAEAEEVDGTWTVDTEIGDFEEFTNSWVGFRVAEVLQNIGETQAVGRTPLVSGELEMSGSTIESARIEADLTGIRSDQSRRDPAIQRALETRDFPTAMFQSNGPVDLGVVPVEGEPFTASVPGTITIHGVEQELTLDMAGQRVGDIVVVVGTAPVDFTSFGITMPTAPVVVSVEDAGDLEWQLFFTR